MLCVVAVARQRPVYPLCGCPGDSCNLHVRVQQSLYAKQLVTY